MTLKTAAVKSVSKFAFYTTKLICLKYYRISAHCHLFKVENVKESVNFSQPAFQVLYVVFTAAPLHMFNPYNSLHGNLQLCQRQGRTLGPVFEMSKGIKNHRKGEGKNKPSVMVSGQHSLWWMASASLQLKIRESSLKKTMRVMQEKLD